MLTKALTFVAYTCAILGSLLDQGRFRLFRVFQMEVISGVLDLATQSYEKPVGSITFYQ